MNSIVLEMNDALPDMQDIEWDGVFCPAVKCRRDKKNSQKAARRYGVLPYYIAVCFDAFREHSPRRDSDAPAAALADKRFLIADFKSAFWQTIFEGLLHRTQPTCL